jgi:hypothetical protein
MADDGELWQSALMCVAFLLWGVIYWGFGWVDKQREQDDDRE